MKIMRNRRLYSYFSIPHSILFVRIPYLNLYYNSVPTFETNASLPRSNIKCEAENRKHIINNMTIPGLAFISFAICTATTVAGSSKGINRNRSSLTKNSGKIGTSKDYPQAFRIHCEEEDSRGDWRLGDDKSKYMYRQHRGLVTEGDDVVEDFGHTGKYRKDSRIRNTRFEDIPFLHALVSYQNMPSTIDTYLLYTKFTVSWCPYTGESLELTNLDEHLTYLCEELSTLYWKTNQSNRRIPLCRDMWQGCTQQYIMCSMNICQ